jgi:heme-degrading monooxygenase HmoA
MAFVFMVFHYPEPGRRDDLVRAMKAMTAELRGLPGCLEVGAWQDSQSDRLVGISSWESREAFLAAGMAVTPSGGEAPEGERLPRERFYLDEAA